MPDAQRWRQLEDFVAQEYSPGTFQDAAVAGQTAFFLDKSTLSLLDGRSGWPPGKDVNSVRVAAATTIGMHLFGGLNMATWFGAQLVDVRVDGDQWRASTRLAGTKAGEGRRWHIEGRWSADQGRGFVDRMVLGGVPDAELLRVIEPKDWVLDPVLNRWIAKQVDKREIDQRLFGRSVLEEVVAVTPAEIERVLAPPVDGKDGFRGQLALSVVHDHARGVSTMSMPGNQTRVVDLPPESRSPAAGSWGALRVFGWVSAACLAAALVWVRVRRQRGATVSAPTGEI
jgi:hypothetical protein